MTNIILQHFDGDLRPLDLLSIDNIKKYADMIDADYQLITGKPFRKHLTPPCQKVSMILAEWDKYENVLMLDIDMFTPRGMKENIFDYKGVGLYNSTQHQLHQRLAHELPFLGSMHAPYWGGAIYKMPRDLRCKLRDGLDGDEKWMNIFNLPYHYEDEGIMHILANKAKIGNSYGYLDNRWCQCSFLPNPENAGFIHIRTKITPNGPKRDKLENYKSLVEKNIL